EGPCGWLKDRYGLSWQVIPVALGELLSDPDEDPARRAMKAMLGMKKIDVAAIQAAADQA
ncbi:MAG: VOC family protein, partial [Actinomycetota bacterium]|nr:VOC family protein [Actinomycetota bacterium]